MRLLIVSAVLFLGLALARPAHAGEKLDRAMKPVVVKYLTIQRSLAADTERGVKKAVKGMLTAIEELADSEGKKSASLAKRLKGDALAVGKAKKLSAMREAFKSLSEPIVDWAKAAKPKGLDVAHCSMVKASWVQKSGELRNPYYGASMLTCGEKISSN